MKKEPNYYQVIITVRNDNVEHCICVFAFIAFYFRNKNEIENNEGEIERFPFPIQFVCPIKKNNSSLNTNNRRKTSYFSGFVTNVLVFFGRRPYTSKIHIKSITFFSNATMLTNNSTQNRLAGQLAAVFSLQFWLKIVYDFFPLIFDSISEKKKNSLNFWLLLFYEKCEMDFSWFSGESILRCRNNQGVCDSRQCGRFKMFDTIICGWFCVCWVMDRRRRNGF